MERFLWVESVLPPLPMKLWSPHFKKHECHCHSHTIICPEPILSQMNLSHILPICFLKINLNIMFLSNTRSPTWFHIFRFPPATILYTLLIYTIVMTVICSMCHKIWIFTDTGVYTLRWGGGRSFSNAHNPHNKTHIYNVIHSGALQKFDNMLELSMYKWFNSN